MGVDSSPVSKSDHPSADLARATFRGGLGEEANEDLEPSRQTNGSFAGAVGASRLATVLFDPALPGNPIVFANQAFLDLGGYAMREVLGRQPDFMTGPDTDPEDIARLRQAIAADAGGVVECAQYTKDGRRFVATVLVSAFADGAGNAVNRFVSWVETPRRIDRVVSRTSAGNALHESRSRFREFGENSSDALWIVDTETRRLEYLSRAFEDIWGRSREWVMADLDRWAETVHPDDREKAAAAMPRLLAGEAFVADYRIVRPDGEVRWIRDAGFPILEGGVVKRGGGIARDVTERRIWESRQQDLVAELQHRVRNILSVIRSIFQRTIETTQDIEEMSDHFVGRLNALARTQIMATRNASRVIDLEALIRDELVSVGVSDGPGLTLAGPDVEIDFETAEPLALAIHELTTNAVKYGALRARGGKLAVRWKLDLGYGGSRRLDLTWTESGVPAVPLSPKRKGFGRELIEDALPYRLGAMTTLDFVGNGVRCTISVSLPGTNSGSRT